MEVLIAIVYLAAVFFISVKSGVYTEMAMDKVTGRDAGENPQYLFGKIAGYFIGMMSGLSFAFLAGPLGPVWGLFAAAFAFPLFAFTIFAYVRAREAISDWRNGRCAFC